jgi:hypothetical protein
MSKPLSRTSALVAAAIFAITSLVSPGVFAGDRDVARSAQVEAPRVDSSAKPAAISPVAPGPTDASRYAARELAATQQGDFQGGGILIIGISTGAVILILVLVLILV